MPEETTQLALTGEPPIAENEQVKALLVLLKENDTILVKASHGMEFSKIVDWLQN